MDFKATALKIVPIGSHPSVVDLRVDIAKWLEYVAAEATKQQREKEFPELTTIRVENEMKKKELEARTLKLEEWRKATEAEFASREQEAKKKQQLLKQREEALTTLVAAFEGWLGWMNGEGEVDDNSKRFEALTKAHKCFKEIKR